ncbi:hypothetical protein R9C00_14470 [Flammeovirgaceae bacterium SG7u.111]|nr:hypothetical protein [Flammeovirgaceae bacterium SG7u.132]WPO38662.1 hypothetical protein R9C00_14470 [Flammeovirgaceae bacterium SG7u.111]
MLPILESDPNRFSHAITQLQKMRDDHGLKFEISEHHTGFASIPLSLTFFKKSKRSKSEDHFRLSNIFVLNKDGQLKELKIYIMANLIIGIAIKDELKNIDSLSLDYSKMRQDKPPKNPYLVSNADLEGMFDRTPGLIDFLDCEFTSEMYKINNETLYRIIAFDDYRCICINSKNQVFKVNFKTPIVQKLFHSLHEFEIALKENNDYVFELFGEKSKNHVS